MNSSDKLKLAAAEEINREWVAAKPERALRRYKTLMSVNPALAHRLHDKFFKENKKTSEK